MDHLEAIIVDIYERELPTGLQVSEHPKINSVWGALVGDGRRLFIDCTGLQPHEAPDRYADYVLEYYDRCMVGAIKGYTRDQPKPGDEDHAVVTAARAVLHDLLQADRERIRAVAQAAALGHARTRANRETTMAPEAGRAIPARSREAGIAMPVDELLKQVRTPDDIAACAQRLVPGGDSWSAYARQMVAAALAKLVHDGAEPSREAVLATLERSRLSRAREYQDALGIVRQRLAI